MSPIAERSPVSVTSRLPAATRTTAPPPAAGSTAPRPRPWRELLLIAAHFLAYKLGRLAIAGHVAVAYDNAERVWRLERGLHLPDEAAVQHALLDNDTPVQANGFYAYVHFPATAASLLWMYLRRPTHYRWARRTLAALTAAALGVHLLFAFAPPRILAGIDVIGTAARYGPSVYGSPQTDGLINQYAAMPSLHVGWAMVVAIGLVATTRSRWRWLWLAYPAITTLVVVGTANHYWLDPVVAGALLAGVLVILRQPPGRVAWHASTSRLRQLRNVAAIGAGPPPARCAGMSR
ncbi:phosphatase PAP2 family protein [Micromonospora phytophila]|uniref:phosphatase PAP2 family protein n=1 Tax=Micromonospora phytophila TaxID=709888 RepID=UPI00202EFF88|nr:phosphatase PAP2 family protein [Micromonospora phytophila]MCM0673395.1 phosphatase PAP2 family protein [Micromonospora phytophila]